MTGTCDFGIVGLGTMGRALMMNIADKGHRVAGLDTDAKKVEAINAEGGGSVFATSSIVEFCDSLRTPRPILILVPAGTAVDAVILSLKPHLAPGDFVIDAGNTHFPDTDRRIRELDGSGIGFMGMGVSGGERGARKGPSMMAGGTPENYARVQPILEAAAARHDGEPCVGLVGSGSAGHFVKMVHNGIEYAMMQAIAEGYDVMRRGFGMPTPAIGEVFRGWLESDFAGFLLEITADILAYQDAESGRYLVELVSDKAKAKGTGKWTTQNALDLGVPTPSIDAAVAARCLSELKGLRTSLYHPIIAVESGIEASLDDLAAALHATFLLCYLQGLHQIRVASAEYGYGTDLALVTRVWREGCIIRSKLLSPLRLAVERAPEAEHYLADAEILATLVRLEPQFRRWVSRSVAMGIPCPVLAATLSYFDGLRSGILPANLIQSQRDLFGAHGFERLDREGRFHSDWGVPEN